MMTVEEFLVQLKIDPKDFMRARGFELAMGPPPSVNPQIGFNLDGVKAEIKIDLSRRMPK